MGKLTFPNALFSFYHMKSCNILLTHRNKSCNKFLGRFIYGLSFFALQYKFYLLCESCYTCTQFLRSFACIPSSSNISIFNIAYLYAWFSDLNVLLQYRRTKSSFFFSSNFLNEFFFFWRFAWWFFTPWKSKNSF